MKDGGEDRERSFSGRSVGSSLERTFWPDGAPRSECGVREDGTEAWTFWYPDGRVQQELVPGPVPGEVEVRRYRPDGTLSSTIGYRDGRKHGAWRTFDRAGRPLGERRYEDGRPVS